MAGLATDGDMRRECIRFNYPDEFLTSVDGNYEANLSGSWLSSLTFNTNRKTYGPFGSTPNRNRRSYFSIHVPGSKIVGFHGRSHRWWSTNFDIGAYLKPIDQQSEYATSTALMLYPSEPPHQPGYPSQTKLNKDDRPQNQKHYAVSNIRVSRNEGDRNGAFYLGDKYKYTNYYIEKADIAHK
ncbi:jacalin-related lectin 12-like isoform X1 [Rosa rugosa]|uniref:jacalin-related lectin 12-like isoform X1 n=1 Tax=Rosa rugosa TaxID=74645 RepID=UPI002B414655|nr:jacalin-related lectin 12-like isoform X1 [Rosa rugosa]XP_062011124.1 jacalin-related lectin 12-like isoform X1 [Rosa rugosa]